MWEDKKDKTPEEYNKWKLTHKCRLNHTGSAGSMESIGSVRVFERSVEKRNLKYCEYLGDGDSSAFKKVIDSKPCGDQTSIKKTRVCRACTKKSRFKIEAPKNGI